jgi:hypothetical protein
MSLTISLTPTQVEQRLAQLGVDCRFTEAELSALSTAPVVSRPERLLLFPTPSDNAALNLSNLKAKVGVDPKHPPSFFEHPWYENEGFMMTPCPPGWHALLMEPIPGSIHQPVDYFRSANIPDVELPLAIEVVLALFLHYLGSREQLLLKKHTWCSDTASMDRHVTVGAFGRSGVFVSGHPGNFASQGLGICGRVQLSESS